MNKAPALIDNGQQSHTEVLENFTDLVIIYGVYLNTGSGVPLENGLVLPGNLTRSKNTMDGGMKSSARHSVECP